MNIYKLPVDAYNRTHEQTISEDAIKDKLVGQKRKGDSESKRYAELAKSYVQGLRVGLAESEE